MRRGVASSVALALLLVGGSALVTLADAHPAPVSEGRAGRVHHHVAIEGNALAPQVVELKSGEHVKWWHNSTGQLHRLVGPNGTFDTGVLYPGDTFDWKSIAPGNYTYSCTYVPTMGGTLDVRDPPVNHRPTVSITSPTGSKIVSGTVLVQGTADDLDQDGFRVRMRVGGGPWTFVTPGWTWSEKWNTTAHPDGDVTIEAQTIDIWGERSEIATVTVTVENGAPPEEYAPAIFITKPHPDSQASGELRIEGVASPGSADAPVVVRVRIDNNEWQEAKGSQHWTFTWDTRTAKDGPHRIQAQATDGTRTSATATVNVLVFNQGTAQVTNEILTPQERDRVSGVVDVRGQANDPAGDPLKVFVRVDGGEWVLAEGTRPWSWKWNTTRLSNGPHVVESVARTATRHSVTAKVTVFVDNGDGFERPTVSFVTPAKHERLTGVVLLQGRATSATDAPLVVDLRVNDGGWENASGSDKWAFTLDTRLLTNGVHRVQARSFDGRLHSDVVEVPVLIANAPGTIGGSRENEIVTPSQPTPQPQKDELADEPSRFGLPAAGAAWTLAVVGAAAVVIARRRV